MFVQVNLSNSNVVINIQEMTEWKTKIKSKGSSPGRYYQCNSVSTYILIMSDDDVKGVTMI